MQLNAHCSTLYNNQDMEATQMSIDRWMNKEDVTSIYNGILLSHKKELNNAICSNMHGPRVYHINIIFAISYFHFIILVMHFSMVYIHVYAHICIFVLCNGMQCKMHFFLSMHAKLLQSCLTLWDPMDCSPPDSSVCGILQARTLEWVAISYSRGSSWPRD